MTYHYLLWVEQIPVKFEMIFMEERKITDYIDNSLKTYKITPDSKEYPLLLKNIKKPPKILYAQGNLTILNKPAIAIVGTRKPSKKGRLAAEKIAKFFVEKGFGIVSGLAQGVDSIAMKAAIESNGSVIGVLPSSLDNVVPKKNVTLAEDILNTNGVLVTEYPEGNKVQKYQFINRNRIISGISMAITIVETAAKGGTMHTVNFAKEQVRPILVVDLPAEGNMLLKEEDYPIISIK